MVRLGGVASVSHMEVFQGLETLFRRRGIDLDWVLYSDFDMMAEAFVAGDIDLAWNGPLGYVKIKRLLEEPCRVIAMRDVDINSTTHFIARPDSGIVTVEDLKGRWFAFGRRSSEQAGLVPYYLLKQAGLNPQTDLVARIFTKSARPKPGQTREMWWSELVPGSSTPGRLANEPWRLWPTTAACPETECGSSGSAHSTAIVALPHNGKWTRTWRRKLRQPLFP